MTGWGTPPSIAELLRNAEMYIKLEEHKKLDFQVQVGDGSDEQNHGKENGMKTPVDLEDLLDLLKKSTNSLKRKYSFDN